MTRSTASVWDYISTLIKGGPIHISLIDPDKGDLDHLTKLARTVEKEGTDLICVAGSTSIDTSFVDELISNIKKELMVPVVVFPSNVWSVSKEADAIFFVALPNSRNPYFTGLLPALMAPLIKKYAIEVIPSWYLIFEPGMTSGKISDAILLSNRSTGNLIIE